MPTRNKIHETVEVFHHLSHFDQMLVFWYTRWRMSWEAHTKVAHWIGRYPEQVRLEFRVFRYRIILWLSFDFPPN